MALGVFHVTSLQHLTFTSLCWHIGSVLTEDRRDRWKSVAESSVWVIRTFSLCLLLKLDIFMIQTERNHTHSYGNCMNSVRCYFVSECVGDLFNPLVDIWLGFFEQLLQVSPCAKAREPVSPRCGPSSVSPDRSLCQMSQNNCYDSQGHWENSSAAGLSAQMSPAVTPGGPPDPPWNNSLLQ